jgi:hypothetical protein
VSSVRGFETWFLVLREEFRTLRSSRDANRGNWTKIHDYELHSLSCLPKNYEGNINKKDEMGQTCSKTGVDEKCIYRVLMGKSEWKRKHARSRCRWDNIIKMNLRVP